MSHKRYHYKLIESADAGEFEAQLKEAAVQQWAAVGYGILPDGKRSALLERKTKLHGHKQKHHDHGDAPAHHEVGSENA
jgi:hypothetical protein